MWQNFQKTDIDFKNILITELDIFSDMISKLYRIKQLKSELILMEQEHSEMHISIRDYRENTSLIFEDESDIKQILTLMIVLMSNKESTITDAINDYIQSLA